MHVMCSRAMCFDLLPSGRRSPHNDASMDSNKKAAAAKAVGRQQMPQTGHTKLQGSVDSWLQSALMTFAYHVRSDTEACLCDQGTDVSTPAE